MPYHRLTVAEVVQETTAARSFVLAVPDHLRAAFTYRAGQYLTFAIPLPSGVINRCYSLSSAPETDERHLKVTVKRVAGGCGSNWFNDVLQAGSTLSVLPPAGRFVLKESSTAPLLMFGGGSGITPLLSLIKSALATTQRRVRLFYANRDRQSILFEKELKDLTEKSPARLDVIHHLDAKQGIVRPDAILAAVNSFENADVYICGPRAFMSAVESTLQEGNVRTNSILLERFEASNNEAMPNGLMDVVDVGVVPTTITIHLDKTRHVVPYERGQTILEAARAAGLAPPSSCEEGFCASCAAKRIKGKVVLAKNDIYNAEDLAENWILTCQGHCYESQVEITYDVF